jgi:DNA-binding NarL/FixJ family response regulator
VTGTVPRVLVVDDDPDFRLLVRLALAPHFEVVGEAGDGEEAATLSSRARPDLVLLDCSLGGTDAFDALPGIQEAAPGARVVLVSGHDPADLRLASRAAGIVGFLAKETPARRMAADLAALVGLVEAVQAVLDEASTRLGRDAATPRAARRFVTEALRTWDLDDLSDTITLLVSELVTNAVVHAGSEVEVLVRLTSETACVEVTDSSEAAPAPRDALAEDTSGRGLALVEAMARRWGVRSRPGGGKTVWFEVDRQPAAAEGVG